MTQCTLLTQKCPSPLICLSNKLIIGLCLLMNYFTSVDRIHSNGIDPERGLTMFFFCFVLFLFCFVFQKNKTEQRQKQEQKQKQKQNKTKTKKQNKTKQEQTNKNMIYLIYFYTGLVCFPISTIINIYNHTWFCNF